MAVKIRLARRGRKKLAIYDIVVSDARSPRDGKFIEKIGQYNPNTNPATILIKDERALYWVMVGAQPTDTAKRILSYKGVLLKKHLQVGVNKGAISQDIADARFGEWINSKESQISGKANSLEAAKAASKKAALELEKKKNEDRVAAQALANATVDATPAIEETVVQDAVAEVAALETVEQGVVAEVAQVEETVVQDTVAEVAALETVEQGAAAEVAEVKAQETTGEDTAQEA